MAIGIRDHIHLDDVVATLGDLAPPTTWKVMDRSEMPVRFMTIKNGLTGRPRLHVLRDDEGDNVALTNFKYRIKVMATDTETVTERKAKLQSLMGKQVYLVDNEHCDEGENHSSYVRTMICADVGAFTSEQDTALRFYFVDVELVDASLLT